MLSFPSRFQPVRPIGEGASGIVYEARDLSLGIAVAVKVLRHVSPKTLTRFKREARAFSEIAHENLVDVHGMYEHDGRWFMAMELVRGEELMQACGVLSEAPPIDNGMPTASLSREGLDDEAFGELPSPEYPTGLPASSYPQVRRVFLQILEALAALARAGVVHRDIKPSNVLVAPTGRVVVLDLGLALVLRDDAIHGNAGTPAYASPEQLAGEVVDDRSDVYAAGTMLYQVLTGRLPYRREDGNLLAARKKQWDPPKIVELRPETPSDLVELCERMMARDVSARPRAAELLERHIGAGADERAARSAQRGGGGMVGRRSELSVLQASLDRARAGYTTAVVVRGKSGLGKTTLLRHFTDGLDVPQHLVLAGRCYAHERVAFRGVDGILESLNVRAHSDEWLRATLAGLDAARDLACMFPVLAPLLPTASSEDDEVDARQRRLRASTSLRQLFHILAQRFTVVVCIDDAQWLDNDGLELLRAVFGTTSDAPILLLMGLRVDETVEGEAVARVLSLFPTAKEVPVGPLSLSESEELVTLLSGGARAAARFPVARTLAECGGDPLLLEEIVARGTEQSAQSFVRADFSTMLLHRANELTPLQRHVVELLALSERPLSREVLYAASTLSGFEPDDVSEALRILRVRHLVRSVERNGEECMDLFHDRVRAALIGRKEWGGDERRAIHAGIARALEQQGAATADPSQLVKHLLEAGEHRRAAELSRAAARRASDMLAFDRAVELLRYAAQAENHGATEELASALAAAGRGCEAADAFLELSAVASASQKSRYLQLAAEQLLTGGDLDRGLLMLKDVLRDVGEHLPRSRAEAIAVIALQKLRTSIPFSLGVGRGSLSERKRRFDALRTVAFGLGMVDNFSAAVCHAKAFVLAHQLDDAGALGEVLATEAIFRGSTSTAARRRARGLIVEARKIAVSSRSESVEAWAEGADAILGVYDSIAGGAIDRLERAASAFHGGITCAGWARSSLYLIRALSLRMAGQFRRLARVAETGLSDAALRRDRYLEVTLRRGGIAVQLAADDIARARSDLALSRWTPWKQGFHIQHWLELEGESELALYEGTALGVMRTLEPLIRAMRRSLVGRLQRVRILSDGLVGRLVLARCALQGLDRASARQLARLSSRLDAEDATDARAHAHCLRAGAFYIRGNRPAAKDALLLAVEDSDKAGLRALAACARLRLGELDAAHRREHEAKAEAFFVQEGVVRPERFANVYVPGWPVCAS